MAPASPSHPGLRSQPRREWERVPRVCHRS